MRPIPLIVLIAVGSSLVAIAIPALIPPENSPPPIKETFSQPTV